MGNIAGSSSPGLKNKNGSMQYKTNSRKAGRRPNEKYITLALFSFTWEPEPMTGSIVQNDSVVFPGKRHHY